MTPLEMRERAICELRVLFGVEPSEENIMYMIGLYTSGVNTFELAVSRLGNKSPYPLSPCEDVTEKDLDDAGYTSLNRKEK